jgi:hypothetical protein
MRWASSGEVTTDEPGSMACLSLASSCVISMQHSTSNDAYPVNPDWILLSVSLYWMRINEKGGPVAQNCIEAIGEACQAQNGRIVGSADASRNERLDSTEV